MFYSKLRMEKHSDSKYKLTDDLIFEDDIYRIVCKVGYIFDGASIPRALWSIAGSPFTGNYTYAACVHDILYQSRSVERWEADDIFKHIMKLDKVSSFRRYVMWSAVRLGGWVPYSNYTMKEIDFALNHLEFKRK